MKKNLLLSLLIIIVNLLFIGFVVAVFAPTFHKQITYNSWLWNHGTPPFREIRYYMSESLLDSLNNMRPTFEEAHEMLGEDFLDTWPDGRGANDELWYVIKWRPSLLIDRYRLIIEFDDEGNFEKAYIVHDD